MIVYTLDLETDPFEHGEQVRPFAAELYDGERKWVTWGENCIAEIMQILFMRPAGLVYIHNGGRFDIFFMLDYLRRDKDMLIIKNRITECEIPCANGFHKIRDSVKILPVALRSLVAGQKDWDKSEIEYWKMKREHRETYKEEILDYLHIDCTSLRHWVMAFIDQFGPALTIGSVAMKELKKFHDTLEPLTAEQDRYIRSKYFFGARVERYHTGVFDGDWKVYDVNSMYPYVMSTYSHPVGHPYRVGREITPDTCFLTVAGTNHGAFPIRTKAGVVFDVPHGVFQISIHEWNAAKDLGLFECDEIIETLDWSTRTNFADYITHYYSSRKIAKQNGDKVRDIFFKLLLNNSYGRFAMNPDNFREYKITDDETDLRWYGWKCAEVIPAFGLILWSRPTEETKYMNIATGASITGAARSVLLRGIRKADTPMYCDTDSIICRELNGVAVDDAALGAWKLEKTGKSLAMAGKKMYALFGESEIWRSKYAGPVQCFKYASKGVMISPEHIRRAALGEVITYRQDAPTFRLDGSADFITRKVRIV